MTYGSYFAQCATCQAEFLAEHGSTAYCPYCGGFGHAVSSGVIPDRHPTQVSQKTWSMKELQLTRKRKKK